tara:strand:- start:58077 stop:58331 length:255 start_codon:yes stop_codon:yes gene_type:complete
MKLSKSGFLCFLIHAVALALIFSVQTEWMSGFFLVSGFLTCVIFALSHGGFYNINVLKSPVQLFNVLVFLIGCALFIIKIISMP